MSPIGQLAQASSPKAIASRVTSTPQQITPESDMIFQGFNFYLHLRSRSSVCKAAGKCLQRSLFLIWSLGISSLWVGKLQAATHNCVSPELFDKGKPSSDLNKPLSSVTKLESSLPASHSDDSSVDNTVGLTSPPTPLLVEERSNAPPNPGNERGLGGLGVPYPNSTASIELNYPIKPLPMQIAAPENFNPGLRLPPPPPQPSAQPSPPPTATESVTPAIKLEGLTTDFRRDSDNFEQHHLFLEETAQFRLRNGNRLRFKTGFNSFEQREFESVTNIPLHVEWEGKINQVTVAVGGGVDLFDRLPTALNFNARVEAPFGTKVSPSGQLRSGVMVSADVEQGPYKFNAQTLDRQITAWRFGPSLYWQIDPNTSLYSSLHLGSYNDGNFEQQSFSRLEHKFGQFSVAANLFNWNYTRDVEKTSGYFSPPDFLVYNGEVGWEGNVIENLRCRLAATVG